ncbi:hypothetical protein [Mesorhizobium sp. ZC-5]|uniref:hypothetical protein n=1 Tax=Mesorhizobium sp. ZC-5 TaxID=2986066 RepID=UPI0021E8E648|nr:hypothetical protein [Mesorhizobium sp. ZC-5]MCV3239679.1 hypothetical protein [Mesorhizobium sp. ZC-5]
MDIPIVYLGNNAGDLAPVGDTLTHYPGGADALVAAIGTRPVRPENPRQNAYLCRVVGGCLTGFADGAMADARLDAPLEPFGLCHLVLKGSDFTMAKIFLGYVGNAEIRDGEREAGVLLAQTNPPAVMFVPIPQIAALHRIVAVDGVGLGFIDSLEQFIDAGLVGDAIHPINPEWRPWEAADAV